MAAVDVSVYQAKDVNVATVYTMATASSTTDGFLVPWLAGDHKLVLLFANSSSAGTITIKAGNGYGGVSELVLDVPASGMIHLELDSTMYKNVSGDNKDKIQIVPSATTITMAAIATV